MEPRNEEIPVGGRLRKFKKAWKFNQWALSIVTKGLGWQWITDPPPPNYFKQPSTPVLREYVRELLQKKVIQKARSLRFQARLFCVPKKNTDRMRVILDLTDLNTCIRCEKFQMLTVSQVRTLLPPGAVTCTIDLTDAYWHIPIARNRIPFLGFRLGKKAYSFKAMPFGLNIAPKIFTKLGKAVVQHLRSQGIMIVAYLDDWLIWAQSKKECVQAVQKVIDFIQSLGFCINIKKSRLVPSTSFQWLGLQWDLTKHTLCLPQAKRIEIAKIVRTFIRSPSSSRRIQERVLGLLQFASIVHPILKARLKDINRVWRSRANKRLRDRRSSMPHILQRQLRPWAKAAKLTRKVPLQPPLQSMTIHTDASLDGWGAHSECQKVQGKWSVKFQTFHINVLEAMAVLLALKRIRPPRKTHIRLALDSTVVMHSINRGGSKSPSLNHVMIAIFSLALKKGWHISAIHIEGVRNVIADSLSRTHPLESEWKLDRRSFQWVLRKVPSLEIDLFATSQNHQLPLYVAPNLDPQAVAMDALSLDWNRWNSIYLFPPINLLLKVLHKLRSFRGQIALIAPQWYKSNWYPLLMELGLRPYQFPNPILTQKVQTKTVFASSWTTKKLVLWIS